MQLNFKNRKQCEELEHSLFPFIRNNVVKEIRTSHKNECSMQIIFRDLTDDENIETVKQIIRDAKIH